MSTCILICHQEASPEDKEDLMRVFLEAVEKVYMYPCVCIPMCMYICSCLCMLLCMCAAHICVCLFCDSRTLATKSYWYVLGNTCTFK